MIVNSVLRLSGLLFLFVVVALAQTTGGGTEVLLTSYDQQLFSVPADGSSHSYAVAIDGDATAKHTLDATLDGMGSITGVETQSGLVLTSQNAQANGCEHFSYPVSAANRRPNLLSLGESGTHSVWKCPGAVLGTQIRVLVQSEQGAEAAILKVHYYAPASIRTGLMSVKPVYATGENAVVAMAVWEDDVPIANAQVNASVVRFAEAPGASVTGLNVIETRELDASEEEVTCTINITAGTASSTGAVLRLAGNARRVLTTPHEIYLGSLAAGSSVVSPEVRIRKPKALALTPDLLVAKVVARLEPVSVAMADTGGTTDAASGDGLYTGTIPSLSKGEYLIMGRAAGTCEIHHWR